MAVTSSSRYAAIFCALCEEYTAALLLWIGVTPFMFLIVSTAVQGVTCGIFGLLCVCLSVCERVTAWA